ncbi:MAG: glycosyltransferase family 2 protein [Bacteroidales bacterium]|jgi:glycosyltransferase involved in cell wall biosynthesis|nr:glycosyltransferase family 2 protein [Bacteroidales bacterium]
MIKMDLSVVVPVFNESESLPELLAWIKRVAKGMSITYEVILVDDGSRDGSWEVIRTLSATNPELRGIRFQHNYGKAAALQSGFTAAQGKVVITMDADLQDSPDEIPELYRMITQDQYDLVSGWKKKRKDPISKRWPSKFFNFVARLNSGIRIHDFNCGLKAYDSQVVKSIEVFGDMHRYTPILAKKAGFTRIGEKVVVHHERKYGKTKYGWERLFTGALDLLTVSFITRFSKKPMHFFGTLGMLMMLFGALVAAWIIGVKVHAVINHLPWREATDQPLFYLALVAVIIGVQLFLAGFLAELVSRSSADRNKYLIAEEL